MATVEDLAASILTIVNEYYKNKGLPVSSPQDGKFEVKAFSIADCQDLLFPAAETHPRVVCTQDEDRIDVTGREGIFGNLTISPPDPDSDDVELDNEQIELQIYSEKGRVWVEITVY